MQSHSLTLFQIINKLAQRCHQLQRQVPPRPSPLPQKDNQQRESFSLLAHTAKTPRSNRQASQANLIPAHFVTDVSPQWDAASTHMLSRRIGPVPVGATLAEIPEDPL